MSTNDDTPLKGQESIEEWRSGENSFPLRDESDEYLALALEDWKTETVEAVDDVTAALLDDSASLTDGELVRLLEAVEALEALSESATSRVPDEHRAETPEEFEEMYGDGQ